MKWVHDILSEPDGEAICVAKVLAVIGFLSFLGYAVWGLIHDHFAIQEFANGLLQVLMGCAGVIMGKNFSEK